MQDKICQALGAVGPHNKEAYIRELGDRNRETDNIIILEKEKLFIVIETKSRVQNPEKGMNTLKPAIEKQMKRRQYFMGSHQDILDCNWRFVSLVALPFIENKSQVFANKVCEQCLDFILDKNDVLSLREWTRKILNLDPASKNENWIEADRSYINLYNRLVGFMSLSTKFGLSSNVFMDQEKARLFLEERVLGEKRKGVTCEEIGEEKILQNISVSDKILKAKPLTSLQVVYFWNEKQLKFLLEDKRLVLFLATLPHRAQAMQKIPPEK